MIIYILRSDGAYCSFQGMTIAGVMAALASMGFTGTVINKTVYQAAVAAQQNV